MGCSVFQYRLVSLEHGLGHLWSSALQRHCVDGVPRLHLELGQDPDAVGQFHRLVEHILTLHRSLGDGEHVTPLQLVGGCV